MSQQRQLQVCLSPLFFPVDELEGKVVVAIDVLRATSTICWALHNGAKSVLPVETMEECKSYIGEQYLHAAEREGAKPEGFDYGNSPFDYEDDDVKGKSVVLTTSNGTRALKMAQTADYVLAGSFLNLNAIVGWLAHQPRDIILLCAGWKNHFNLEDTLFAGAVVDRLMIEYELADDSALASRQLYVNMKDHLMDVMKHFSHYKRLAHLGAEDDIRFCLTPNQTDIIPHLKGDELLPLD